MSGGVCADCWGVKDPERAVVFQPEPKTEPLFDWDGMFGWLGDVPWIAVGIALAIVALLIRLALGGL